MRTCGVGVRVCLKLTHLLLRILQPVFHSSGVTAWTFAFMPWRWAAALSAVTPSGLGLPIFLWGISDADASYRILVAELSERPSTAAWSSCQAPLTR